MARAGARGPPAGGRAWQERYDYWSNLYLAPGDYFVDENGRKAWDRPPENSSKSSPGDRPNSMRPRRRVPPRRPARRQNVPPGWLSNHERNARLLRHALATLAYRGAKALRDAPPDFAQFRGGTRTPREILAHIGDLMDWALHLANGEHVWRDAPPLPWDAGGGALLRGGSGLRCPARVG